ELHNAGDDAHLFEQTLQHLATSRLLTLSGGENQERAPAGSTKNQNQNHGSRFSVLGSQHSSVVGRRSSVKVDIAHEALIRGWPTLQGWLKERRDVEQTRRRLEGKAAEWVRLGRGDGGLLDEVELVEAERWLESPDASDMGSDETLP